MLLSRFFPRFWKERLVFRFRIRLIIGIGLFFFDFGGVYLVDFENNVSLKRVGIIKIRETGETLRTIANQMIIFIINETIFSFLIHFVLFRRGRNWAFKRVRGPKNDEIDKNNLFENTRLCCDLVLSGFFFYNSLVTLLIIQFNYKFLCLLQSSEVPSIS